MERNILLGLRLMSSPVYPQEIFLRINKYPQHKKHIICKWIKCPFYGGGCTISQEGVGSCDIFKEAFLTLRENFQVFADVVICKYCQGENGSHLRANCPNRFMFGRVIV
jgi:hypothetical protein